MRENILRSCAEFPNLSIAFDSKADKENDIYNFKRKQNLIYLYSFKDEARNKKTDSLHQIFQPDITFSPSAVKHE